MDQNFYRNCYDKAESLLPEIKMAVFFRDPQSKDYTLVYSKGIDRDDYEMVSYDIKYSPINDVILGDQQNHVPDVSVNKPHIERPSSQIYLFLASVAS
ncbi:MAG: hypothetical protein H8D67_08950 [Deltaproteobacteria bacterium]|nr:hypothetical protein [Deltaproteobacteria bacterium]